MALRSMTGYGRGKAVSPDLRADVELSSVNRKQLDVHVSLPKGLLALESRVTQQVARAFSRGFITVSVRLAPTPSHLERSGLDRRRAAAYVAALRRAAARLGLADDLSARTLVELPDVLPSGSPEMDTDLAWTPVRRALAAALLQLAAMRRAEGAAVGKDLRRRLQALRRRLKQIRSLSATVTDKYRRSLLGRLKASGLVFDTNSRELARELALFADRSDITEEITRLDSHLGQADQLLTSDDPVGRTLDFLTQEMFREINTIGSKANDTAISRHVVMFKTELERIREQVQNVE